MRIGAEPDVDVEALGRIHHIPEDRLRAGLAQLMERGFLIERDAASDGRRDRREVPAAGCEALGRLVAARRERLGELWSEWPAERRQEVARMLGDLARELVPEPPKSS